MRTGSPPTIVLRFMFAVLFGFMSVVPMPLRMVANPASHQLAPAVRDTAHEQALHGAVGHHDHGITTHHHGNHHAVASLAGDEHSAPQQPNGAIVCKSVMCCMAVTQPLLSAPASGLLLLGQITLPRARVIVAVTPDPVVPPPRRRS